MEEITTILPICMICGGTITPSEHTTVYLDMATNFEFKYHTICLGPNATRHYSFELDDDLANPTGVC